MAKREKSKEVKQEVTEETAQATVSATSPVQNAGDEPPAGGTTAQDSGEAEAAPQTAAAEPQEPSIEELSLQLEEARTKLDEYWAGAISMRSQYAARGLFVPKELTDRFILQVRRELKQLTDMTGGRILESQAFDSLGEVYQVVADELKNQYYLSYNPTNLARDGRWRNIEVRVRRPGVVTKTRPGYFADSGPPAGGGTQ